MITNIITKLNFKSLLQNSMHDIDWMRFNFDFLFISLSVIAFYESSLLLMITVASFILFSYYKRYYQKNRDTFYLDSFIDFLNQINANLCIGMGFDAAILNSSLLLKNDLSYSSQTLHTLNKTIKMGVLSEKLYEKVCEAFPIYEATLFSRMMHLSKDTGANPSEITRIIIDKLYLKHKVSTEIELILFQKKMEQSILCLAPMLIILFIKASAPDYLDIMYQTFLGKMIMTVAFSLILMMKFISERIIKFKF